MKKYIVFFSLSIVIFGCEKVPEFKYYRSQLYPVKQVDNEWKKTAHFKDIPVSIRLESTLHIDEDYSGHYMGKFEPIVVNTAVLSLDKDIVLFDETFRAGTNLLETRYAEIEHLVRKNGSFMENRYFLWLNRENITDFYTNKGYYTVYFKAITEHNYEINDSTVICIE